MRVSMNLQLIPIHILLYIGWLAKGDTLIIHQPTNITIPSITNINLYRYADYDDEEVQYILTGWHQYYKPIISLKKIFNEYTYSINDHSFDNKIYNLHY